MDKALKQRLVGASVLVALAVVILPMLLGGQGEGPQESQPIEIPPRPAELSFETRRFPIGDQSADESSVLPEQAEAAGTSDRPGAAPSRPETLQERLERVAAESAESRNVPVAVDTASGDAVVTDTTDEVAEAAAVDAAQAAADEAVEVAEQVTRPAPASETPPPAQTAPVPVEAEPPAQPRLPAPATVSPEGRYVVQVASFSSTANADRLAGTLQGFGMPVLMDTVDSSAGVLHRVRIGPFDQQAEADQVLSRLSREVPDVRPRLVDLRPDDTTPVTQPGDPLVRWSVQVGVFSASENAEQLVFRLRDAGYRAQSQREQSDGEVRYRVLVGPELSREDAVRSRDRIEATQGIKGIVLSTD